MKRLLIICHEESPEEREDCSCQDSTLMHRHEMTAYRKAYAHKEPSAFPDWLRDFFERLDQEEPSEDLMDWV